MQLSAIQTGQFPTIQAGRQKAPADPRQTAKIGKAASEFEALLISQMLRSARESGASDSDDDGSQTNSYLMELGEQQFAQSLANSGGLGIAKMVVTGLSKDANR